MISQSSGKMYDKAIWLPFFAISLVVIPIFHLGFEIPKLLCTALFSLCAAFYLLYTRKRTVEIAMASVAGMFLLLFVSILILSPLWSVAWVVSLLGSAPRYQGVLFHMALVCIALFCAVLSQNPHGKHAVKQALLISNIVVIAYGILQMMHLDPFAFLWDSNAFLGRTFSTIGHPNALGQYIVLTVPFCIREIFLTQKQNKKMVWTTVVILNAIVLAGTVSRSAMVGLLCITLIYAPFLKQWWHSSTTLQRIVVCTVTVLAISLSCLLFVQRFSQSYIEHRSISAREVIWNTGLPMIIDRPQGYGLETLSFVTPSFLDKEIYAYETLTTVVDRMHNQPLELLVTLGPLGLIAYYGFIISLVYQLWRKRTKKPSSWELAILSAIVGYSVALLFGFPSVTTAVFFWTIAGVGLGSVSIKRTGYRLPSYILNSVFCIASVVLTITAVQWIQAQRYSSIAQGASGMEHLAYLQEGIMAFRFDRQAIMQATQTHIEAYEKTKNPEIRKDISLLQEMHHSLTGDSDGVFFLLQSWNAAVQGEEEQSAVSLQKAHRLLPNSITYYRSAMHIAHIFGDTIKEEESRIALLALLPEAYFQEGSQTRRLLQKQHPWLLPMTHLPPCGEDGCPDN